MFFKWIAFSSTNIDEKFKGGCAPSILNMFINMLLFKRSEPLPGCNEFMFEGQNLVQLVFICVALLCIPVMLLGKPLYIMFSKKNHHHVSLEASIPYTYVYLGTDNENRLKIYRIFE